MSSLTPLQDDFELVNSSQDFHDLAGSITNIGINNPEMIPNFFPLHPWFLQFFDGNVINAAKLAMKVIEYTRSNIRTADDHKQRLLIFLWSVDHGLAWPVTLEEIPEDDNIDIHCWEEIAPFVEWCASAVNTESANLDDNAPDTIRST